MKTAAQNSQQDQLSTFGVISADWPGLQAYLAARDLGSADQVLKDVCANVRAEFGADAELDLEIYSDPEIDDQYLTLYVRLSQYAADHLARLDRISQSLGDKLDALPLLLTSDFRQPRCNNGV